MATSTLDIDATLAKLSLPQKIKLLTGLVSRSSTSIRADCFGNELTLIALQGWWHTEPVPQAGIPSMRFSDGRLLCHNLVGSIIHNNTPL